MGTVCLNQVIVSLHVMHLFHRKEGSGRGDERSLIFTEESHPYINHRQSKCFNPAAKRKFTNSNPYFNSTISAAP